MEEEKKEEVKKEDVKVEEKNNNKPTGKYGFKFRAAIVTLFVMVAALVISIIFRIQYLNIKEVGENFTDIFYQNVSSKFTLMGIIFVISFIVIYITNKLIKYGLSKFFKDDNKKVPKLPNKSFALVGASIISFIGTFILQESFKTFTNIAWFGKTDPIFGQDISYYIFSIPFIQSAIYFAIVVLLCLIVYIAIYYVSVMNIYLDGVDIEVLKKNTFIKQIITIVGIVALLFAINIFISSQNIMNQEMLTVENTEGTSKTSLTINGAGRTDVTIKYWGYRIFAFVFLAAVIRLLIYVKKSNFKQIVISISVIPVYLIGMFVCMIYYDNVIVKNEVLDNEKTYIAYNIDNTKEAYGINIEQKTIDSYDTISYDEITENKNVIENIPIISSSTTKKTIEEHQEEGIYYSYDNTYLQMYNSKLIYLTPREILSNSMSYNNRTYKYTHGYSAIISYASEVDENGYIKYALSDYSTDKYISEPRIYFGVETDSLIATNTKLGKEFDYPITATTYEENTYDGESGLNLGLWDKLLIGASTKNFKLAFSSDITKESKIISNRNIIERARAVLPDITYDDNPYLIIRDDGTLYWVLDGYTTSNDYPYSQSTVININGENKKINYIRNSVKVIIDAYNGTTKFYITDRNDPLIMAYRNMYPTLFEDLDEEIPEDISSQFKYSKVLFDVQSKMARVYHDISEDVLYRAGDVWEITPDSSTTNSSIAGQAIDSYYTMLKTNDSENGQFGLVVTFNKESKQNITSYMVGTCENGVPKLSLYKFNSSDNIPGIVQLNSQIAQDETISKELETLDVSGSKISKNIVIVPINNTLLYVESIYQVRLNESEIPVLKKVIVASGNKLAIGNNLSEAISNLFTDEAVDLEIVDMQDINDVIDALIKSNTNLEESLNLNDFELIGKDLSEVENLIKKLEELRNIELEKEKELKEKESKLINNEVSNEIVDNTISNDVLNKEETTNELSKQTNNIQNNTSANNINNSVSKH